MIDDRSFRAKQIAGQALNLPGAERSLFLEATCRDDPALRAEVDLLLSVLPTVTLARQDPESSREVELPTRFRNFRLIRLIGEGGMGSVFEAEQANPRRIVALKIVRPGFASREHLHRFEHEAQLLGRLQHPGIARIYEAGWAEMGQGSQPYYAMELITGGTLVQHAAERNLGIRERLELVAKICDAVHYAHQMAVIHRDLKPGNILVDSFGQPKVVDFGVARLTDPSLQATTMHTHIGQLLGTVHYMSPEQITADPDALSIQSDVYSLGIIGYELLSGRLPYDLRQKTLHETARIISEEDPRPLSSLNRSFRGDLETIISKALEKETSRRYESAAALAADLRRFLADRPIEARPPSTLYHVRKFAKRNRALVGGIVATVIVLIVGAVASTVQYFRAEGARREAVAARDAAVKEAAKARAVTTFLQDMLASARPDNARGREVTVREVLEASTAQIDTGLAAQPLVEAAIRVAIGRTYRQMGRLQEAEPHLRKALAIRERELGPDHADAIESKIGLADLLTEKGERDEAESLLRSAVEASRRTLGNENTTTIDALHSLGYVTWGLGKYEESEHLHREALEARRRTLGSDDAKSLLEQMHIGMVRRDRDQLEDAEAVFRDGLERSRRALGNDRSVTLHFMNQLGEVLAAENKLAEAEPLLSEALATRQKVLGFRHKLVGETLLALSDLRYRQGRLAEAEDLARKVVTMREESPDRTLRWARRTLLKALLKQGKYVEARPFWQLEAEALKQKADDPRAPARAIDAYARFLLTSDPERWRDPERGLAYAQRAAASADGKTARIQTSLARAYRMTGDVPRAVDTLEQALALVTPDEASLRAEIEASLQEYRRAEAQASSSGIVH